jgi:dsDNA-binding SOS-regulon protein
VNKQVGGGPTEGALARVSYISHVKNNILPLLRQTFGAAFTAAEGDSLLATLGDPDMHPDEKKAALAAFIADKRATLETLRRQTGKKPAANALPEGITEEDIAETMKANNMTRKQVLERLRNGG